MPYLTLKYEKEIFSNESYKSLTPLQKGVLWQIAVLSPISKKDLKTHIGEIDATMKALIEAGLIAENNTHYVLCTELLKRDVSTSRSYESRQRARERDTLLLMHAQSVFAAPPAISPISAPSAPYPSNFNAYQPAPHPAIAPQESTLPAIQLEKLPKKKKTPKLVDDSFYNGVVNAYNKHLGGTYVTCSGLNDEIRKKIDKRREYFKQKTLSKMLASGKTSEITEADEMVLFDQWFKCANMFPNFLSYTKKNGEVFKISMNTIFNDWYFSNINDQIVTEANRAKNEKLRRMAEQAAQQQDLDDYNAAKSDQFTSEEAAN